MRLYVKKTKNKQGVKESLWIDFTHNGERHRKPLNLGNTPANKKIALNHMIPTIQLAVSTGEFFKNKMITVSEYMDKSFELQSSNRKAPTIEDYRSKYNKHLKPVFGKKMLDSIKGTDITLWQNKMLKDGYAIRTIKGVRGILSTMFEDAIREEIIEKNPIRLASLLSARGMKKTSEDDLLPFTINEIKTLIASTETTQMKNFYMLLFTTGLRGGEAIGLKWNLVDFDKREIKISSQIGRGVTGSPKWDSFRTVPIIESFLPFIKSQFEITGEQSEYVFLNTLNNPYWDISKIREGNWKKDLERAKVQYRKIHQTRHTFCSTMISAGEDINLVSKVAGHSSPRMTLEVYSKYIPRDLSDFGNVFNKI
ncbi:tyrosine-type recombinase/integrase [Candidatus Sulfurimonas baltica]|uniref:Tyrosine-type recombinase/integrase n=1 Tax=Candidatus Sulfurimonas baltica TaxID=2740404 RepID=A0A7S7LWR9_9BACT|nr:tyrosine-type recombinase/integrase [Candidatus Sulfurimonas baltica]QOY52293.1 tyrosine-type recombinase/integrase [Candidatus Sulfurimonas baltica]